MELLPGKNEAVYVVMFPVVVVFFIICNNSLRSKGNKLS